MLISKKDAKAVQNSPECIFWEYAFPSEKLGIGPTMIAGRYPEKGWAVRNKVCDEAFFVVAGTGVLHDESGAQPFDAGDLLFFPMGKWYWLEGHVYGVASTSPPFFVKQHEKIPQPQSGG
jgi:mannose-6-phosphate isomerase-like protein (cupin superfamily)